MVIQQNGSVLTVSISGTDFTANLNGTIDTVGNLSMAGQFVDEGDTGDVGAEASTSSDSSMTGTYRQTYTMFECTVRGKFQGSKR